MKNLRLPRKKKKALKKKLNKMGGVYPAMMSATYRMRLDPYPVPENSIFDSNGELKSSITKTFKLTRAEIKARYGKTWDQCFGQIKVTPPDFPIIPELIQKP